MKSNLKRIRQSLAHTHRFLIVSAFTAGLAITAPLTRAADYTLNFTRSPDTYVTTTGRITTTAFTVEAWIRQPQFDAENQIFNQDIAGDAGRLFLSTINGKTRFQVGGTSLSGNTTLSTNVWYHLAFVRSASGASTNYLNGAVDGSGALTNAALAATNISIGRLPRIADIGFRGQISDVRVWNFARSRGEIQADMSNRLDNTRSGLIHYWPFNDGSGTIATNLASNAHGAITGATWANSTDFSLIASTGSWGVPAGGNWSATGNWLNATPAQGTAAAAFFTNNPPAAITVTNDMPSLTLATLTVNGTNSHTFTGNSLSFTNRSLSASIATTTGSHFFELPVQVSARSLILSATTPGLLTFSKTISGDGGLNVNPMASGGGTVTLSGTNTYVGSTTVGCGTLSVASLADGGLQSAIGASSSSVTNLVIGPGTFRYTGPSATINRGFTASAGTQKAALFSLDSDLTLTGPITNVTGALIKTGSGTLTYAAPVASLIGRQQSASITTLVPYPANGDSPANGFGCFTVARGKVILGAHPAQTNLFNEEVTVGAYTTDQPGQEVAAELEFVGGYSRFNAYFDIGYYNGNTVTAPTPLQPTVTVSGGTVSASKLIIAFGYQNNQNTRPVLNIAGGTMIVDGEIRFGDQRGAAESPMHATMNVYSGAFRHPNPSANLTMGWRSPAANGTINLYGGLIDEAADISMGQNSSVSRLNLHGGTLRMRNLTASSGEEYLTLNGGVLQPRTTGYTLSGLTSATVSTNGAIIDTSLASYTVAQNLLTDPGLGGAADGGLLKLGTNTLTLASYGSTYKGSTVVSNGTLCIAGVLPANNALLIATAGEALIGGSATQTVTAASLALNGGTLGFAIALDGSTNDRLTVSASPVIGTGSRISLYQPNSRLPFTKNGAYTILTYSGADPASANLSCANPVYGKTYTFAASGGNLTVTLGTDASTASVWKTDGSGNWSDAGNWTVAPASQAAVRFDDAITAPATVTVAGQTAGDIFLNNAAPYTFAGSGLTLGSGTAVNVESGSHTFAAPLTLAGNTTVNLSSGAGICLGTVNGGASALTIQGNGTLSLTGTPNVATLSLTVPSVVFSNAMTIAAPVALGRTTTMAQPTNVAVTLSNPVSGSAGLTKTGAGSLALIATNTYSGVTTVSGGTLAVSSLANGGQPSAIGTSSSAAANLVLAGGTLRYSGPTTSVNRGFTLNPGSAKAALLRLDSDLTVSGSINNVAGGFIKTGPGTLRYTLANAASTIGAGTSSSQGTQGPYPANGDAPANGFGCLTIAQGKVILGAPGQTNYFNGEAMVGAYTTSQAGQETTGELEFIDGYSVFSSLLDIGYYNGTTLTAPVPLQPTVTVSGGMVTAAGMIIAFGYNNFGTAYPNTHAVLNIAGGTLTITGTDFRFGDQTGSDMLATINVTSGALIHTSTTTGMGSNRGGNNTLNLYGGLVDEYADIKMGANSSTSRVNLNGGLLRVRNITGSTGSEYLTFNGGTLQPRSAGQTMADNLLSALVSTNGAVIDTSLASYTIAQKLTHDPLLGSTPDGGLVKLGTNTLSVTGTNTFSGPVIVQAGLLKARISSTNDLLVATNAYFDALSLRATVGNLTGNGTLTNGVIALTGALDAGTNNAPAGARMTVENLSLAKGSTFVCTWSTNGVGQVTNDFVTVTGTLAPEGAGFIDFGRTEANPIPMPFQVTIMSYGTLSGSFAGWKSINTGLPAGKAFATVVTASNGFVTLGVRYGGMVILIR